MFNPAKLNAADPKAGLVQTYSAHGYEVLDIAVTDDNARFASVGGDKQVFLWDVATARTLRRWGGHFSRVNCVGFGGDGDSVVISGTYDFLYSIRLIYPVHYLILYPHQSCLCTIEPRLETELISVSRCDLGSFDSTVRIWDCKSQSTKPIQVLEEGRDSISSLHVREHEIVTGSVDGRMRLYDMRKGVVLVDCLGRTSIYINSMPVQHSVI